MPKSSPSKRLRLGGGTTAANMGANHPRGLVFRLRLSNFARCAGSGKLRAGCSRQLLTRSAEWLISSRKKWCIGPALASTNLSRIIWLYRPCDTQFERLKCLTQHGRILLSVVATPPFPKCEGPYPIVWYGGFAISDDVLDVLTWT